MWVQVNKQFTKHCLLDQSSTHRHKGHPSTTQTTSVASRLHKSEKKWQSCFGSWLFLLYTEWSAAFRLFVVDCAKSDVTARQRAAVIWQRSCVRPCVAYVRVWLRMWVQRAPVDVTFNPIGSLFVNLPNLDLTDNSTVTGVQKLGSPRWLVCTFKMSALSLSWLIWCFQFFAFSVTFSVNWPVPPTHGDYSQGNVRRSDLSNSANAYRNYLHCNRII